MHTGPPTRPQGAPGLRGFSLSGQDMCSPRPSCPRPGASCWLGGPASSLSARSHSRYRRSRPVEVFRGPPRREGVVDRGPDSVAPSGRALPGALEISEVLGGGGWSSGTASLPLAAPPWDGLLPSSCAPPPTPQAAPSSRLTRMPTEQQHQGYLPTPHLEPSTGGGPKLGTQPASSGQQED